MALVTGCLYLCCFLCCVVIPCGMLWRWCCQRAVPEEPKKRRRKHRKRHDEEESSSSSSSSSSDIENDPPRQKSRQASRNDASSVHSVTRPTPHLHSANSVQPYGYPPQSRQPLVSSGAY